MTRRIAVIGGNDPGRAFDREIKSVSSLRHKASPAVSKFRRNKKQIFAASLHRRPVYCKLHKGGLPSRFNSVFGPRFSVPVSHNPYLSRFVTDAVPTQAIFERPLAAQALRTSVDEELGSIARSVDMNGRHFTFAAGPCPVRQDVSHRQVRTPPSLIKIITILGESRQIDDPEIGAARRDTQPPQPSQLFSRPGTGFRIAEVFQNSVVVVIGRGFPEVVEPGPDELPGGRRIAVEPLELCVGRASTSREKNDRRS